MFQFWKLYILQAQAHREPNDINDVFVQAKWNTQRSNLIPFFSQQNFSFDLDMFLYSQIELGNADPT